MRIGFFGGSFDPIHLGHLILAEQCREQAQLDQVWFVPSSMSPLKQSSTVGSNRQRLEMVQIAIAGHRGFQASEIELERGGVSFTVDTLRGLQSSHPDDEWFLVIGGDSLVNFSKWREPEEICRLAIPLIYSRPNSPADLSVLRPFVDGARMKEIERNAIRSTLIDISSTELRRRVAVGQSIRYLTPRAVEKYIESNGLYVESKTPRE